MTLITKSLLQEKCQKVNPPVTENDIKDFEKKVGANLPQDLKDFYLLTNGCDFKTGLQVYYNNEVVEQIQWIDRLDELLIINKDATERLQEMNWVLDRFEKCWSIGCGAFRNRLYIDYSKNNYGEIYVSQIDKEYAIENDKWFIPMVKVANSFGEFIQNSK